MQKKLLLFLTVLLFPWAMKAQTNFHEGFESGIPSTWTNIDSDNDGYNWVRASVLLAGETISPHDGTDFVCSQSYDENDGDLTPDNWLVTPAITVGTAEVLPTMWQFMMPVMLLNTMVSIFPPHRQPISALSPCCTRRPSKVKILIGQNVQ